jgi:ribosome-associated translation inhibitor RaiA
MKLVIHGHQLGIPRDARAFLRTHVVDPLARLHDGPATELTVGFDDARPRKGGVDQVCRLTYRMPNSRTLTVESVADDIHAALLDAAKRLKRLVEREIGKMRSRSRSPMHKPIGRSWRASSTRSGVTPAGDPSSL